MSHPNPAVVFPRIVYSFFLSWAAELAARLKQEDKEANSNWVPSIISPKTLRPISVDIESIQANLDRQQAAALADKALRFSPPTYDGTNPARLPTQGELREIFTQCGSNLPVYAPSTAWLSATRGIAGNKRRFSHDGSVLTVNSETKQAEWRGPNDGGKYGLLFVRDEHSPS
jgi:hypothetical protein